MISQKQEGARHHFDLSVLVKNVDVVSFTFNEPTIYYQQILRIGNKIDKPIVIKTNGHATNQVWQILSNRVAAYNVDIKGTEEDYARYGGSLRIVQNSIEILHSLGHHIEISYPVLKSQLTNDEFHHQIAQWLSRFNLPIHILVVYPYHKITETYLAEELLKVRDIFCQYLDHVYISNVYVPDLLIYRNTYCPVCKELIATRNDKIDIKKKECCGKGFFRRNVV